MQIVRARGVETETSLPFAGLVDLLTPLTECLPELPERQANAVRSALAIGATREADRLAVLVGAFNLLCAAASRRPLLVLVDDAQWLDAASSEAITFAARRIGADHIGQIQLLREAHLPRIYRKLGVRNRAELAGQRLGTGATCR